MSRAAAIVPAAGASRRMGRDKLLLPWGGSVVIDAVLAALEAGGVGRVAVVTAPGDRPLERWVGRVGHRVVVNPAPERGMLSSIWEGLTALGGAAALAATSSPLLVCPGDLPAVDAPTVSGLIAAVTAGAALAVPSHEGRRGHPLAISSPLVVEIPALDPGRGLRQLLDRHRDGLVEMEVTHPGVVWDLDTPADYAAALRRLEASGTGER